MTPKFVNFLNYTIFIYSNENDEPIHVHVSHVGSPDNNSKFWIHPDKVELAHNKARLPSHQLKKIETFLAANVDDIIRFWNDHFA